MALEVYLVVLSTISVLSLRCRMSWISLILLHLSVCAGPNGSGKSNLLEVLAAIFYQLEVQRVKRNFLPKIFEYDSVENPNGIKDSDGTPNAYELEYLIKIRKELRTSNSGSAFAHVRVIKEIDKSPSLLLSVNENTDYDFELPTQAYGVMGFVLPQYAFDNNDEDFKFRTPNDKNADFLLPAVRSCLLLWRK